MLVFGTVVVVVVVVCVVPPVVVLVVVEEVLELEEDPLPLNDPTYCPEDPPPDVTGPLVVGLLLVPEGADAGTLMLKVESVSGALALPAASVTVSVQVLYVPFPSVLRAMVEVPAAVFVEPVEHGPSMLMVPASVV